MKFFIRKPIALLLSFLLSGTVYGQQLGNEFGTWETKDVQVVALLERQGESQNETLPVNKNYQIKSQKEKDQETWQNMVGQCSFLYGQKRFEEGVLIAEKAYQFAKEKFGKTDENTLSSMGLLVSFYVALKQYDKAKPLLDKTAKLYEKYLGKEHPNRRILSNDLAMFYFGQQRYSEAEPLFLKTLSWREKHLGEDHENTVITIYNLGLLYQNQKRYKKSQLYYGKALSLQKKLLGKNHPATVRTLNNLIALYRKQGKYEKMQPLWDWLRSFYEEEYGVGSLATSIFKLNRINVDIFYGKEKKALRRLKTLEQQLFNYLRRVANAGMEAKSKQKFRNDIYQFQNVVYNWGLQSKKQEVKQFAIEVLSRWSHINEEEELYLRHLLVNEDPNVVQVAKELENLGYGLLQNTGKEKTFRELNQTIQDNLTKLNRKEAELQRLSPVYKRYQRSLRMTFDDIKRQLPKDSALLFLKKFETIDFSRNLNFEEETKKEQRFMAVFYKQGTEKVHLFDLETAKRIRNLSKFFILDHTQLSRRATSDKEFKQLIKFKNTLENTPYFYNKIFKPLHKELAKTKTLFLVPDGLLFQIPFERLKINKSQFWIERGNLRRLQTGRALFEIHGKSAKKGLLALGNIQYNESPYDLQEIKKAKRVRFDSLQAAYLGSYGAQNYRRYKQMGDFSLLPETTQEITKIKNIYQRYNPDEEITVRTGLQASEKDLKHLKTAPRVLHLATHGFCLEHKKNDLLSPFLFSGVALAGANLEDNRNYRDVALEDGVLFGLEVPELSLEGTELVALSGLKTEQRVADYSIGLFSLARTFRIAGAKSVLLPLKSVDRKHAKNFMTAFYENWLKNQKSSLADALRKTKLDYIRHQYPALRKPQIWSPYILVE